VVCNGETVMKVSGTKARYDVDVYSGNHPFYKGGSGNLVVDEGRLNKFKSRYGEDMDFLVGDAKGITDAPADK